MKKFLNFFLSSKATLILLIIFGVAMAAATFIEDKYDTVTARSVIYNTTWFELLFVLLIINLFGHIKAYNLFSVKKLSGLLFHLAFVLMILGAFITRYFGFEGSIHIRKGEASNMIYSADPFLMISYNDGKTNYNTDFPISIGTVNRNSFHASIPTENKGNIDVRYKGIMRNAIEKIEENVKGGRNLVELGVLTATSMQNVLIKEGEVKNFGKVLITYNNDKVKEAVQINEKEGKSYITSPFEIIQTNMNQSMVDTLGKDSLHLLQEKSIYIINGLTFVYSKAYKSAVKKLVPASPGDGENMMQASGSDAVVLDVTINGKSYEANVINSSGGALELSENNFDGTILKFGFGNKPIELPFSLYLKDFIFEKYPGSESPSSYKSEVTLIDEKNSV